MKELIPMLELAGFCLCVWAGVHYLKKFFGFTGITHTYRYRNPYDRKCVKCGYHENMYQYAFGSSGWETMHYGKAGHVCSNSKAEGGQNGTQTV